MKKWIIPLLAIAALMLGLMSAKAESSPYGKMLQDLWAEGLRLEKQGNFAGAQKAYENALQQSQQLPDPLLRGCATAHSRVGLETMMAAQKYINERGGNSDIPEGVNETIIQQYYATWEKIGQEMPGLAARDCP